MNMNINLFSPNALAIMYNDLIDQTGDKSKKSSSELLDAVDAITRELDKNHFYMQYVPAKYKLTPIKTQKN